MRKTVVPVVAAAMLCLPAVGTASAQTAEPTVFAGGGTPLTNGIFFPGTLLCAGSGNCTGVPYEIERGTDVRLVNLDSAIVANGHGMISKARKKRTGAPLFRSKVLRDPGETTLVITSNLKPGTYEFGCQIHAGMEGVLKVVD